MKLKPSIKVFVSGLILFHVLILTKCTYPNSQPDTHKSQVNSLQEIKEAFIDLRFGMFICYNIMSYGAKWGESNYPIDSINPQKLDCNQWAEAAVSAGMKFGLLTTKHHEGFCLWDSKHTNYDIASTPYKKDIVRQYVDAFRKKDLKIGLYYSIWDSTHGIDKGNITEEKLDFIKGQITELLTLYGKIDYFVMDGWYWKMGHHEVPYHEIRKLIKNLQPDCLITDHTHLQAPYHMDIPYFEGPFGAFPAQDNTMASALGHCSVKGNGWFWNERTPDGLFENDGVGTITQKLNMCEQRYCNFMLNCMPNRSGLLDPIYVDLLKKIGEKWEPDYTRPSLPDQGAQIAETIPIKSVNASSGNANFLFDARQKGTEHFHWESDTQFPQTITIDLGTIQNDIDILTVVPNHRCKPAPESALEEGNLLNANIYASKNGKDYEKIKSEKWESNSQYKTIQFGKRDLQFLKLEILESNGEKAIIAELEVGKSRG
ncbi:MAG: alpha-L-fucosidase [Reichenbachiella sp.]